VKKNNANSDVDKKGEKGGKRKKQKKKKDSNLTREGGGHVVNRRKLRDQQYVSAFRRPAPTCKGGRVTVQVERKTREE